MFQIFLFSPEATCRRIKTNKSYFCCWRIYCFRKTDSDFRFTSRVPFSPSLELLSEIMRRRFDDNLLLLSGDSVAAIAFFAFGLFVWNNAFVKKQFDDGSTDKCGCQCNHLLVRMIRSGKLIKWEFFDKFRDKILHANGKHGRNTATESIFIFLSLFFVSTFFSSVWKCRENTEFPVL